ncbi:uncharacterized protein LOC128907445 [Rissa tridactyla]|uniref:uncharacterized protein LOC128907445 n=1 Tax=Rissa tridactyla TaxID=75485 RepID=UPI0023BA9D78|nr:uncharacterized protein LOC128907445 [Rissa tridactyla]
MLDKKLCQVPVVGFSWLMCARLGIPLSRTLWLLNTITAAVAQENYETRKHVKNVREKADESEEAERLGKCRKHKKKTQMKDFKKELIPILTMHTGTVTEIMTGRIYKKKVSSSIFTCHNPWSGTFIFGSLSGEFFSNYQPSVVPCFKNQALKLTDSQEQNTLHLCFSRDIPDFCYACEIQEMIMYYTFFGIFLMCLLTTSSSGCGYCLVC